LAIKGVPEPGGGTPGVPVPSGTLGIAAGVFFLALLAARLRALGYIE
jgi:hypothetical protein